MQQLRLARILLEPSPSSSVATCITAIAILVAANWTYSTRESIMYGFFYGEEGVITKLLHSTDTVSVYLAAFSARYITYEITVFIFAIAVGLFVYLLLEGFSRMARGTNETYSAIKGSSGKQRLDIELSFGIRVLTRAIGLFLWFLYWTLTLKILLPFSVLATRTTLDDLFQTNAWMFMLLGIAIMTVCIHLHIVFARLVLLKPRLFGGRNEIMIAMLEK
jgi:hypothetical protein